MKLLTAMLCAGAMIAAAPVSAASIKPDGPFQADGTLTFTKGSVSISCTAHFAGSVANGFGQITAASFTGGPSGICSAFVAVGLPWLVVANSTTSLSILGIAINTPLGNCTASNVTGTYSNATHIFTAVNQPLPPDCKISMTMTMHDSALVIVP